MRFHHAVLFLDADNIWKLRYNTPVGPRLDNIANAVDAQNWDIVGFFDRLGYDGWQFAGSAQVFGDQQPELVFVRSY